MNRQDQLKVLRGPKVSVEKESRQPQYFFDKEQLIIWSVDQKTFQGVKVS